MKKEKCKYCQGDEIVCFFEKYDTVFGTDVSFNYGICTPPFEADENDDDYSYLLFSSLGVHGSIFVEGETEIHYCPICGRKLKNESAKVD